MEPGSTVCLFSTSIVLFSVFLEDMGQDNVTREKRGTWGQFKSFLRCAQKNFISICSYAMRERNDPRTETQRGKPSEAASREERSQRARYVRGRNLSRSLERAPYLWYSVGLFRDAPNDLQEVAWTCSCDHNEMRCTCTIVSVPANGEEPLVLVEPDGVVRDEHSAVVDPSGKTT